MENRIARTAGNRPGAALIALVAILGITAAWWALALWPVGAEPEWLARTRAACFGSRSGGLPDAGGWILLIGEPIGMLGMLFAGWRQSVVRDLRVTFASRWGRLAGTGVGVLVIAGIAASGMRVARASAAMTFAVDGAVIQKRLDMKPPNTALTDQHGQLVSLADFSGRPALVTFAFGHCSTVCPVVTRALRVARDEANRADVPILVVTLDPWRDTPERLSAIAEQWEVVGDDRVLSGDVAVVEGLLDAIGIGRQRDDRTGDVTHGITVLGINAKGRIVWRADNGWSGVEAFLRP